MRLAGSRINGLGRLADFVPGMFAVPETPVQTSLAGFAPGRFSVPENPVGLGRLGRFGRLGCGGSGEFCSACSGGMGAIDLSLTGTGIGGEVGLTTVPNYVFYGVGALLAYMMFFETSSAPRYVRRR